MAHVDNDGWLVNDPGDTVKIVKLPRKKGKYNPDYGALSTASGKPIIFVHHITGTYGAEGADAADRDGTAGMAKRVASGDVQYYAHVYLSRDGVAYQMVPFTRAAPSVEGSFKQSIPPEGKGKENNKIAASMEWTAWGGTPELAAGKKPTKEEDVPKWEARLAKLKAEMPKRSDLKLIGKYFFWQIPTLTQAKAAADVVEATVKWSAMNPEAAFYGHKEIGSGAHGDPGNIVHAANDVILRPRLGLVPKLASGLFPFATAGAKVAVEAAKAVAKAVSPAVETVKQHPYRTLGIVAAVGLGVVLIVKIVRRRRSGMAGFSQPWRHRRRRIRSHR